MTDEDVLVAIGINRRGALVRLAGAAALPALPRGEPPPKRPDPTDPNLVNPVVPWDKILTAEERETAAALCDVILPADERSPAASAVETHDFIDEWVSAPYPRQLEDRRIVRGGLAWLNTEANRRTGRRFSALSAAEKRRLCDDIADPRKALPRLRAGAVFFERIRTLALIGYYTTLEGMKDVGYVGNVPALEWKGPPPAVLRHLKLG